MKREIISEFSEKPKTRTGWRAMWLGIASFVVIPLLGLYAAFVSPLLAETLDGMIIQIISFSVGILAILTSFSAVFTGVHAIIKGERSWLVWLGLAPALLVMLFWLFMIIGELVYQY